MLPLLIAVVVIFSVIAVIAIINGPTKENATMAEIEARLKREEELVALKLSNELLAKELEESRKRKSDAEVKQATLRAEQKANDKSRQQDEKHKQELAEKTKQLKQQEEHLQDQITAANVLASEHRSLLAAAHAGNHPHRWPTRAEYQHALATTQYSTHNFHFAVVGRAGSGKSSLVNAFRNLMNKAPGAAPTGTRETTLSIGRYPDPGTQPPRKWMVWFDVPGAGTHRVKRDDYFVTQGLYVFDLIILVVGDRFEEVDAQILQSCERFGIPAFVVRSKADMHILNSMKEYGYYERFEDDWEHYRHCRDEFIRDTQSTVNEEMARQGLTPQHVYIVSRDVLQRTYHASLQISRLQTALTAVVTVVKPEKNLIHEVHLVNAILEAAADRRCEPNTEKVRSASCFSRSKLTPVDTHGSGERAMCGYFW